MATTEKAPAVTSTEISTSPITKTPAKKVRQKHVLYIDSSFFFPANSSSGYVEDYQNGRYIPSEENALIAPVILPVGSKLKSITIYYINTSDDTMHVDFVRKHTEHHAYTEEYLISSEGLAPGTGAAPDFFASKIIDHFGNRTILEKYLYYIMISNTGKTDAYSKTLRGIRICYWH